MIGAQVLLLQAAVVHTLALMQRIWLWPMYDQVGRQWAGCCGEDDAGHVLIHAIQKHVLSWPAEEGIIL